MSGIIKPGTAQHEGHLLHVAAEKELEKVAAKKADAEDKKADEKTKKEDKKDK